MVRVLFIYNPKAGKGSINQHLSEIINIFSGAGYSITIHATQRPNDAVEVVRDREKGMFDMVVCSGGDGTLDEVVTGMIQGKEPLPIGYIPAGSTNDFAKSLKISNNMIEAANEIVKGTEFPCDAGIFNEDTFVYIAAFGLFTEVSYTTDQKLKNVLGHMAYILEGAKSLTSVKSYKMRIENEEGVIEGDFIYGMITNSISVGGMKHITGKDVRLDDGMFEVTLVRMPTSLVELNSIITAFVTNNFELDSIIHFKASCLKIVSEEAIKWTLDGEYGGTHRNVVIKVKKKAILIICNNK